MDPLSIGSAVVGLVLGGCKIIKLLQTVTNTVVNAPKSATAAIQEVTDIGAALSSLQAYLMGAAATTNSRAALVSLENIVVTLTGCVTSYSELETITEKCCSPSSMGAFDRVKWAFHEGEINGILQRLQRHKTSMIMMLQILQAHTQQEVNDSVRRLVGLVEASLQDSNDLRIRMLSIEADHGYGQTAALSQVQRNFENEAGEMRSFEKDLQDSRVYGRVNNRHSLYELSNSQRGSMALSSFSELSLGSVSKISVLSLPIWSVDLANSRHYLF
ncbi:uncharacterized protein BDZ99DRAFT_425549, partial [Mytilinidion resinicola]